MDDIFGLDGPGAAPPAAASDQEEEDVNAPSTPASGHFSMIGDDDDDDLPIRAQAQPEPPSALTAWSRAKALELNDKDARDAEVEANLRAQAQDKLHHFQESIAEARARAAKRNEERDSQTIAALTDDGPNAWEKIAAIARLSEPGPQTKDVAAFKSLLIELKTKPPTKG
jgi:hypothetical protein